MSAKILSSLTEENRDLRKQIGCMNGIFQLFDRRYLLTGRRISSQNHKRLLLGPQHQKDPQCSTKALTEKEQDTRREKPRISMESSRASYSSSSCSSTFSSLDSNRRAQPETPLLRQINIPDSSLQIISKKKQNSSLTKEVQSLDLRDVVKDSMYREARSLPIKSRATDERRCQQMKHIDSPRPTLQQSKTEKPKAMGCDASTQVQAKIQEGRKNKKDDRPVPPRFSYDGRESQESFKSPMKFKELPRLSLDSKTSSMKSSSLESRVNFLRRDLPMEYQNPIQDIQTNQEPGTHRRSSSLVAKLMGLEDFPEVVSAYKSRVPSPHPQEAFLAQSSTTAEKNKQSQVAHSPRISEKSPASPSPRSQKSDSLRTRCSSFQMEPAPWRQNDFSRGSTKLVPQDRKSPTSTPNQSSSVYGEIERRITQLEFKTSGKDLRALKQILEAMEKTRARLEHERGECAELTSERGSNLEHKCQENHIFTMENNRKNHQQVPSIKEPSSPCRLGSSIVIMRPAKVIDKVTIPCSRQVPTAEIPPLRRLQTRDPKYPKDDSGHRPKAKVIAPKSSNLKDSGWHRPPAEKKAAWRTSEIDPTLQGTRCMKLENYNKPGRSSGMVSPRLQQVLLTREGQFHPTVPVSESPRVRKHSSKKLQENDSRNRKIVKSMDLHLADDLSDISSETRNSSYHGETASVKSESNNSQASHIQTEFRSFLHSKAETAIQKEDFMATSREGMPTVDLAANIVEQPSPVSVLDAVFYSEDLPSPVKNISTAFQADENSSPDEAEWNLENLNPLNDCITSNRSTCNQKFEDMKPLIHELKLLKTKPDEKAANNRAPICESLNPDHRYINKILLMSGLLKDTSFISTGNQLPSSCHLINPEIFHVLEQTESILDRADAELIDKNDKMKLPRKSRRKIVFDLVNEILVRKITSGRLFSVRKKRISPRDLLNEVYSEVDRLQKMSYCNLEDEDDGLPRLSNADMINQPEDWREYSGEVPALVLDIERLIFKDLISEVVTGEVLGLHDWPKKHCRQLF